MECVRSLEATPRTRALEAIGLAGAFALGCCESGAPGLTVVGTDGSRTSLRAEVASTLFSLRGTNRSDWLGIDGARVQIFEGPNILLDFEFDGFVDEMGRDPLADDTVLFYSAQRQVFGIARGGEVTETPIQRIVRDFEIVDFDGDGASDVVAIDRLGALFVIPAYPDADYDTSHIEIGSIERPLSSPLGGRPRFLEVADFDGDGAFDVVACTRSDQSTSGFRIYYGSGVVEDGSADACELVAEASLGEGASPDLVLNTSSSTTEIWRYSVDRMQRVARLDAGGDLMDVGDISGDGVDDLVLADVESTSPARWVAGGVDPGAVQDLAISGGDWIVDLAIGNFLAPGDVAIATTPPEYPGCG